VNGATPADRCELDAVDQIVKCALVDQPRNIALECRLGSG
jgi:hypothetical protein